MGEHLALLWPPSDEAAAAEARVLGDAVARHAAWTEVLEAPGVRVWSCGARPPPVRAVPGMILIGDCYGRGTLSAFSPDATGRPADLAARARGLCGEAWGRYVAVLRAGGTVGVFRDPSGGMDAHAWRRGGVSVVTSEPGAVAPRLLPRRAALDWEVIAQWLMAPSAVAAECALSGVAAVPPGGLMTLGPQGERLELLWRPGTVARRAAPGPPDAAEGLAAAVDLTVAGLAGPHDRLAAEISGGLDSAIVAAALVGQGLAPRVGAWLNYHGDRPEGDERASARAVAARLGLRLTCLARRPAALTEADFAETARGLRPAIGAIDPAYDREVAARLTELGAGALVSGQGGDVVFFQMPTSLVAGDALRAEGLRALRPARLVGLAGFAHASAWGVLGAMVREGLFRGREPHQAPDIAGAALRRLPPLVHDWSRDARDLPPARRLQIRYLAHAQVYFGPGRRRAAADLLHPLLAQPVVEHCLALSTLQLTEGRRDRALARAAFADRLPAAVLERRSKGDLSALYGRTVLASLPLIRELLLDGSLCEAGLLDRARLEAELVPDRLIWRGRTGIFLVMAAIESWVRWWQARLPDAGAGRSRP